MIIYEAQKLQFILSQSNKLQSRSTSSLWKSIQKCSKSLERFVHCCRRIQRTTETLRHIIFVTLINQDRPQESTIYFIVHNKRMLSHGWWWWHHIATCTACSVLFHNSQSWLRMVHTQAFTFLPIIGHKMDVAIPLITCLHINTSTCFGIH